MCDEHVTGLYQEQSDTENMLQYQIAFLSNEVNWNIHETLETNLWKMQL